MSSFFEKLFGKKQNAAPQPQENVAAVPSFEPSADLKKVASLKEAAVLFVDDDPDLRIYIHEELSDYFKEVLVARDGTDALELLKSNPAIDIIISDMMMPEMDGLMFCRAVKRNPATHNIAFVLLTARADKKSEAAGFQDRADAFLSKPFDIDDLIAKVESLILFTE